MQSPNFTLRSDFQKSFQAGHGANSRLSKTLADAIVDKAADMIESNGSCSLHENQPLIAFDETANSFFCHQCIFENGYKNPEFVTLKARKTFDTFNERYNEF